MNVRKCPPYEPTAHSSHYLELITNEQLEKHSYLRLVGLVGSIDNDMCMTDLTIGAPTALQRICESLDNINSTAYSHSRAFVVEVMGRDCGWLALMAGIAYVILFSGLVRDFRSDLEIWYSGGADFIFIPERPPTADVWEDHMCDEIQRVCIGLFAHVVFSHLEFVSQHRQVGKRKTIVIVAEGAQDKNLLPIKAEHIKNVLSERLGLDTRVTTLGHTQRGGRPCAVDRIMVNLAGI